MSSAFRPSGIYSAQWIPVDATGRIDRAGLAAHIEFERQHGVAGVLALGSTGEFPHFSLDERKQVLALVAELAAVNALPKIEIHGLMTVAPWSPDPEKVRPVFRRLREIKQECESILGAPLPHLSMGMSGDFEAAVEEGATLVRIGSALFGPRPKAAKLPETSSR